ncbi:hypothetical protein GCM10007320_63710 [Pseudorhodoferax aquiterrae]|uniref:DUF378 domain-containing protein n=1 Tax=Pseudorhodoferax aquiterrae TaxID=747304 RepID=A0ABQ3GGQ6_9BURK|nr:DUF378 domain-containing protein [Pseudorhodoferax aquiterrae]GHD03521.1 hypothetical protein GCM10007320_63710 [Pseudorhodoferax aquiterrae]
MASSYPSAIGYPTSAAPRIFNPVDYVALLLLIVGGLNWGLVGVFNFDLVAAIFGTMTTASRIVYALVGVSALYSISLLFRRSRG